MELSEIPHKTFYRKIKYPRIELRTGELHFILPPGHTPEELFLKHRNWINTKLHFIKETSEGASGKELIDRSDKELRDLVRKLAERDTKKLRVTVEKITFRKMRSKWASLSRQCTLTANILLKHLPLKLLEYVIFHEITHTLEKRHNSRFWEIVSREFPRFRHYEQELFRYWFLIANNNKFQEGMEHGQAEQEDD